MVVFPYVFVSSSYYCLTKTKWVEHGVQGVAYIGVLCKKKVSKGILGGGDSE